VITAAGGQGGVLITSGRWPTVLAYGLH